MCEANQEYLGVSARGIGFPFKNIFFKSYINFHERNLFSWKALLYCFKWDIVNCTAIQYLVKYNIKSAM